MQTKKSDYQELKKSICKNYLKGVCSFGKECKYRHPPKQRTTVIETEVPVCRYFLQNNCRRGDKCPYIHIPPKPEKLKQRSDWLTFCLYFPSGSCKNKDCRFLHITENDKDVFRTTGKIGPHILEQAMCKALLQDVSFNGTTPTCKEYLQGHCKWMSCPMHHLTRQEFSQAVSFALDEKFSLVLGPSETYKSLSANGYDPNVKYQQSFGYDSLPAYKSYIGHDRYVPAREKYVTSEPYRMDYVNEHSWHDRDRDQQNYISSETDRIIKGIYNLMKEDASLIRNVEKQEITDLRGKLDNLAEENARYRYEFSRMNPYERERYKVPMLPTYDKNNLKYQDIVRRLEKENFEMRRQLSMLQEQEHKSHYMGKPEPTYLGRPMMEQEHRRIGGMGGQSHLDHSMRSGEDLWYGSDVFGARIPPTVHVPYYNPLKQKVNNQLRHNMIHQYKGLQQINQGASQYNKVSYQKSQKHNQQINRKSQQQYQKTQKVNTKVNQNQKKKQESQNSNQAKSVKPKKATKSESDKEDNVPKVETEDKSNVEEKSDKEDKNESSKDNETRVTESRSDKEDNESSQDTESHVESQSDKDDKEESSQEIESHVESHSDEDNESSQEIEVRISEAETLESEDSSNVKEKKVTNINGNQEHSENEMEEVSKNTSKDADVRQEKCKIERGNEDKFENEKEREITA